MVINDIRTYGGLLDEIERTEKAIEEVKNGFFYEYGDEMDLYLYLVRLKETKRHNDAILAFKKEHHMDKCIIPKCNDYDISYNHSYDVKTKTDIINVTCNKCGHKWIVRIQKHKLNHKDINILHDIFTIW